jgi:hypothetical protein
MVATGAWYEAAPRVYRSAIASRPTWLDDLAAVVLSCDGIAARRSAAALYDLLPAPRASEILVVRGKRNLDRTIVHSDDRPRQIRGRRRQRDTGDLTGADGHQHRR